MSQILVSLSSFGAAEVRRHGQLWFTRLAQQAGADGVEVRGELLLDGGSELPALAEAAQQAALQLVYSSPQGLWSDTGDLDMAALERALACAGRLGAPRLKMALGGYARASHDSLRSLRARLAGTSVELVIENDRTAGAGTLGTLQTFFDAARERDLGIGMTFDIGNWHWSGECPLQAAQALAPCVRYVHCKGVQRQPRRWVVVALADSIAPWRAVLRALPPELPWAIEYPLVGDDLLAVTRAHVAQLRALARSLS